MIVTAVCREVRHQRFFDKRAQKPTRNESPPFDGIKTSTARALPPSPCASGKSYGSSGSFPGRKSASLLAVSTDRLVTDKAYHQSSQPTILRPDLHHSELKVIFHRKMAAKRAETSETLIVYKQAATAETSGAKSWGIQNSKLRGARQTLAQEISSCPSSHLRSLP